MKTIRMPKEKLEKWLTALRSGEYDQAQEVLHDQDHNAYCCLGVLMACNGTPPYSAESGEEEEQGEELPLKSWLDAQGITFSSTSDMLDSKDRLGRTPYLPLMGCTADQANDSGHTFAEIADAIEKAAETY